MNIPVVRVWKKKWWTFFKVNLFICSILVIYITHYMTGVVAGKYEGPKGNVTHPCHEADLLFFHWRRLKVVTIGCQIVVFINIISVNSWLQSVKKYLKLLHKFQTFGKWYSKPRPWYNWKQIITWVKTLTVKSFIYWSSKMLVFTISWTCNKCRDKTPFDV